MFCSDLVYFYSQLNAKLVFPICNSTSWLKIRAKLLDLSVLQKQDQNAAKKPGKNKKRIFIYYFFPLVWIDVNVRTQSGSGKWPSWPTQKLDLSL